MFIAFRQTHKTREDNIVPKRPAIVDRNNPYNLTNGLIEAYTTTHDTHKQDPSGLPTRSILTIKLSLDRKNDYHVNEIFKQSTRIISTLIGPPNFRFQPSVCCHFHKRPDRVNEKEATYLGLEMNHMNTQSDLESSVSKVGIKLEARIEEEQTEGSVCVLNKITSMQLEMFKTVHLTRSTYVDLPLENKAFINIKIEKCWEASFRTKTNRDSTISSKNHFDQLDLAGNDFNYGVSIENLPKLESELKLKVNVFKLGWVRQTKTPKLSPI